MTRDILDCNALKNIRIATAHFATLVGTRIEFARDGKDARRHWSEGCVADGVHQRNSSAKIVDSKIQNSGLIRLLVLPAILEIGFTNLQKFTAASFRHFQFQRTPLNRS